MSDHNDILQKYKSGDVLAHFRANWYTNPITPASFATLFSMRWTDQASVFVLERAAIGIQVMTAVTPQSTYPLGLLVVRNYTSDETTGISNLAPRNNTGKAYVNMPPSRVASMYYTTSNAGISGGAVAGDTMYIGEIPTPALNAVGVNPPMTDFLDFGRSESYPYIFSTNEGFYVRWGYTAMATGSVMVIGQFSWAEVELD